MRQNHKDMYAEVERTLAAKSSHEWEAHLNQAGVPCMRVATISDAVKSEQIRERRFYHTFDKAPGLAGPVTVPLAPFHMSMSKAIAHSPPPTLGQHTADILKGLGYSEEQISSLRSAGTV
jgi:crotonobetainyl-CoA:carnitine CoA-transferase CaiB-like acyl-CoA transferase